MSLSRARLLHVLARGRLNLSTQRVPWRSPSPAARHARLLTSRQEHFSSSAWRPQGGGTPDSGATSSPSPSASSADFPVESEQSDPYDVTETLKNVPTVEAVLATVDSDSPRYANAVCLLAEVSSSVQPYATDPRFEKLMKKLGSADLSKHLSTPRVLAVLKAMGKLEGIDQNSMAVQNLENSLVWRARHAPIRELTMMLSFAHGRRPQTGVLSSPGGPPPPRPAATGAQPMKEVLFQEVVRSLERRWVEVVDGRAFVGILHYSDCFSEQYLNKIDDRITEMAESLVPSDLVLVCRKIRLFVI